jgi:hypothetical protein
MEKRKHKKVTCVCIFCGTQRNINIIFIPPLDYSFKPVCNDCIPTLDRFRDKFRKLWND